MLNWDKTNRGFLGTYLEIDRQQGSIEGAVANTGRSALCTFLFGTPTDSSKLNHFIHSVCEEEVRRVNIVPEAWNGNESALADHLSNLTLNWIMDAWSYGLLLPKSSRRKAANVAVPREVQEARLNDSILAALLEDSQEPDPAQADQRKPETKDNSSQYLLNERFVRGLVKGMLSRENNKNIEVKEESINLDLTFNSLNSYRGQREQVDWSGIDKYLMQLHSPRTPEAVLPDIKNNLDKRLLWVVITLARAQKHYDPDTLADVCYKDITSRPAVISPAYINRILMLVQRRGHDVPLPSTPLSASVHASELSSREPEESMLAVPDKVRHALESLVLRQTTPGRAEAHIFRLIVLLYSPFLTYPTEVPRKNMVDLGISGGELTALLGLTPKQQPRISQAQAELRKALGDLVPRWKGIDNRRFWFEVTSMVSRVDLFPTAVDKLLKPLVHGGDYTRAALVILRLLRLLQYPGRAECAEMAARQGNAPSVLTDGPDPLVLLVSRILISEDVHHEDDLNCAFRVEVHDIEYGV